MADQFKMLHVMMWGLLFGLHFCFLYYTSPADPVEEEETCSLQEGVVDQEPIAEKCEDVPVEEPESVVDNVDECLDPGLAKKRMRKVENKRLKSPIDDTAQMKGPRLEHFVEYPSVEPVKVIKKREVKPKVVKEPKTPAPLPKETPKPSEPSFLSRLLSFINRLAVRLAICVYIGYLLNFKVALIYLHNQMMHRLKLHMENWKEEQAAIKGQPPEVPPPKPKPKSKIPVPAKEKEEPPPPPAEDEPPNYPPPPPPTPAPTPPSSSPPKPARMPPDYRPRICDDAALSDPDSLPFSDPVLTDSETTQVMKVVESKQWSVSGHVVKSAQRIKYIPIRRSHSR